MPLTEWILLITSIGGVIIAAGGWVNTHSQVKANKDNDIVQSAMAMVSQWRTDYAAMKDDNTLLRKENEGLRDDIKTLTMQVAALNDMVKQLHIHEETTRQTTTTTSTRLDTAGPTPPTTSNQPTNGA